jgi:Fe-S-cluster-containing dehydrogenase component/CRP-like cAMP-binding protein
MTAEITSISRPNRWDVPFSSDMREQDISLLLSIAPFCDFDRNRFPPSIPLEGILLNDTRIRKFERGDIIVRESDYGDSAFLILSGAVQVILNSLPVRMLGQRKPAKKNFFSSLTQLWQRSSYPEVRDYSPSRKGVAAFNPGAGVGQQEADVRIFLQDVPRVLDENHTARLAVGEFFGEIAALSRTPRTATVIAEESVELLEIRWQGMREIRRYAPAWEEHINRLYRERSLLAHLRETPFLKKLPVETIRLIADHTRFESVGDFDWDASYRTVSQAAPKERLQKEPVIVHEGDYPNSLILIRSGFARVSHKYNHGERTLRYLGKGQFFGLEEILSNAQGVESVGMVHTLRAIGHVDLLIIPAPIVTEYIAPQFSAEEVAPMVGQIVAKDRTDLGTEATAKLGPDMLEFLVENRYINGTAAMLIDLDRCTRCDDCVRACAATHDNNPKFIRHGRTLDNVMVATACMHCVDPVCMIGCPTGAIHRESLEGQVAINDLTCIGCSTCANSCPYDNIQMVEIRDRSGNFIVDEATRAPIMKATKCDLCVDQLGGPACVPACPHDALIRADMRDVDKLAEWFDR